MANFLPLIAQRILNRPLALHPNMADALHMLLDGRIDGLASAAAPRPEGSRFIGSRDRDQGAGRRRYVRASGRTALITVDGSLVNRGAWVDADFCTGLVSYEGIAAQLDEVAADNAAGHLDNLVIDINSYGGEASGMAGLAAKIRSLRKTMHVVSVVNDVAASAGYGIASSADRVVISPTSLVGSIGVVMLHLDRSAELSAKGVRPTLIHAGAKKVDGHPFGPLPDNVRADMLEDVMAFYEQFLGSVEAGRGNARLSSKKARETEADTFIGAKAISAGLADDIGSLDEVLAELSRPRRASTTSNRNKRSANMERDDVTQARSEERARIKAILASEEGKKRPEAALNLALGDEGISAATAIGILATLPEQASAGQPQKPATPTIAERAADQIEIGGAGSLVNAYGQSSTPDMSGWKAAMAKQSHQHGRLADANK